MEIQGKVAIVTGGTSGLGAATARALVREGAKVAIWGRSEEKGQALVEELGSNVMFQQIDVTDAKAVEAGIEEVVQKFGALHIVANNAGHGRGRNVITKEGPTALEDFSEIVDLLLVATYNVLRLSAWAMSKQDPVNEDGERGVIIHTSSIAADHGQRGQQAYSAGKGGIQSMLLPVARGLARNGIRVAAIAPGLFNTPIYGNNTKLIESLEQELIFPRRFGKADEFASLFLEIVRNPMINGTTIRLDGAVRF